MSTHSIILGEGLGEVWQRPRVGDAYQLLLLVHAQQRAAQRAARHGAGTVLQGASATNIMSKLSV